MKSALEKVDKLLDIKEDNLIRRGCEVVGGLNDALIRRQKVTDKDLRKIKKLHLKLQDLFAEMRKMSSVRKLRAQVSVIEKIEFAMQKAWGFPINANFHTWWRAAPHCTCPASDNRYSYGTSNRVIDLSCVLHGTDKPSKYKAVKLKNGEYCFKNI